ncbi:MGH1-like glycoside hydrolase domain-containing protein [Microvirga sp. CF3016]|uniref:MGH1-like glycoside hydrolase domain-containing protein n=1 Tax=Microvirga sp. CF3016 TaxID=3110181 RepID=UPI002E78D2A8|nr:trehalase family glycosidase [Microvirga sp. CF3016]MEE1612999.1 trehalase family glycosidase [Microvirga sp. CF3016]
MNTLPKEEAARAILARNDRGGYTVPTDRLYPFQWNWDSAFVAMGFAIFDVERAYRELERLAEGQWDDGMIPHIVFHAPSDTYFPGPDVWGTRHRIPTSGITQPAVFGMALRHVHEAALAGGVTGATERTKTLFQAALRSHRWWLFARDPEGLGLVSILHPWESGSDNSPAWDEALARVPTTTTTTIRRKDTGHVDASMRPRDEDYQRFIHLVDTYRDCGWDPKRQWAAAPFKVADVQMTAILARATADLMQLAETLGTDDEKAELARMHARLCRGLARRWRPALSRFVNLDLISGRDIETPTQAAFIPLVALTLDEAQRNAVTAEIERWLDGMVVGVPSTPAFSPAFEPKRYWRGPVWAVINWLICDGLRRNGSEDLARQIEQGTVRAIENAGFCEYFDPTTGEGLGGDTFSWTAAAYMVLGRRT